MVGAGAARGDCGGELWANVAPENLEAVGVVAAPKIANRARLNQQGAVRENPAIVPCGDLAVVGADAARRVRGDVAAAALLAVIPVPAGVVGAKRAQRVRGAVKAKTRSHKAGVAAGAALGLRRHVSRATGARNPGGGVVLHLFGPKRARAALEGSCPCSNSPRPHAIAWLDVCEGWGQGTQVCVKGGGEGKWVEGDRGKSRARN